MERRVTIRPVSPLSRKHYGQPPMAAVRPCWVGSCTCRCIAREISRCSPQCDIKQTKQTTHQRSKHRLSCWSITVPWWKLTRRRSCRPRPILARPVTKRTHGGLYVLFLFLIYLFIYVLTIPVMTNYFKIYRNDRRQIFTVSGTVALV